MTLAPGDCVHLAGIGTGVVREARGGGRYAVEIKGRIVIARAGDLEAAEPPGKLRKPRASALDAHGAPDPPIAPRHPAPEAWRKSKRIRSHPERSSHPPHPTFTPSSLDLHGKTVEEALAAVEVWINEVLLAGHGEARVIHGRGGGRLKSAVHQYLRGLRAVASFRLDPHNPGVTIVTLK